ncbi:juvenile hormone esterase-like [Cotesia typhae]|uniref:juvenile hormone esterase-like n=1 Tax=Cotesia typhae TaxID=2053667 RepID=UPI003D69DE07
MLNIILIIIIVLVTLKNSQAVLTEVTNTSKGLVQGKIFKTVGEELEYSVFFGIPFAKPPVDQLRFKPPEEAEPWNGVRDATREPNLCPQKNPFKNYTYDGDEDCLYLNLYTPKINSTDTTKRAVMIWFYAGAFVFGSISPSAYGPDFLIEEDIVVVMPNHRLGALGFLSLNHKNATGNAGLKDLVLALRWIQENIENFGGDPERVTVFGDSSGSAAVGYLVLSELATGLFHSAISMSGVPLNIWAYEPPIIAQVRVFILGLTLGIFTLDKDNLIEQLRNKSAEDIVGGTKSLLPLDVLSFAPTTENPTISTMPFLTECALEKYKSGNFNQVPQIIGFVDSELMAFIAEGVQLPVINMILDGLFDLPLLREVMNINLISSLANWIVGKLGELVDNTIYGVSNITSDLLLIFDVDRTQRYLTAASDVPVYYYRNSFDHQHSRHRAMGYDLDGTAHADDVHQIFWPSLPNFKLPLNDTRLTTQRQRMVRMWSNFAKYRDPTPNGTMDPLLNITWPPSTVAGISLEIDTNYSIGPRPVGLLVDGLQMILNPLLGLLKGCV